jgi:WD40 repeat protein
VCQVSRSDGHILLAAADDDGRPRLWDPVTDTLAARPVTGHDGWWVHAMCAVPGAGGRTLLATAGDDAAVRLWDPTTGDPVGSPLRGHLGAVLAVVPLSDGRTALAIGGNGPRGEVSLLVPATGAPLLGLWTGRVTAVCPVSGPDGTTLVATVGPDDHGFVQLWDPDTSRSAGIVMIELGMGVRAMCAVPGDGGRTLLAVAGREVHLYDPTITNCEQAGRRLVGHTGAVSAMCTLRLPDGQAVLASAGVDRTVRLWHLATGELIDVLVVGTDIHSITPWTGGGVAIGTDEGVAVLRLRALVNM